jgi:hypothetical protein
MARAGAMTPLSPRAAVWLTLLLVALVLVSGFWLFSRLQPATPTRLLGPPPTWTPKRASTASAATARAPAGYRLAGVAVGEPESFAVVEAPGGMNALYRNGDTVPGLGRIERIEAERIVVRGDAGEIELWLTPAATPTPGREPTAAPPTPTARARAATTTPRPPTPVAGTARGSTP